MSYGSIWLVIGLAGLGTFLTRLSFLALVRGDKVSEPLRRVLRLVPAAVLAAIVLPATFPLLGEAGWAGSFDWPRPVAVLIASLAAWRTRNMFVTIAVGMACLWLFRGLSRWLT